MKNQPRFVQNQIVMPLRFVVLLAVLTFGHAAKLPSNWKVCKKAENKNVCLKNSIETAVKDLVNGNPSLGVFPMDPMRFKQLVIGEGLKGPVSIKLEFKDTDLIGLKNINVKNVKNDWDSMVIEADAPKIEIIGNYSVNGKVLILPVVGSGKCKLSFDDFKTKSKIKLEKITKNGKKYYNVKDFLLEIDASHVVMRFDNLFNGDKALGDNFNVFINENWKEIVNELKPSIAKAYGAGFKEVANRIFSRIPADVFTY